MKQRNRASFLDGPIAPTLLSFITPILLSNVIQQLYTTVDRVIVGRFVSKEGLAAVGVSFPIIFLLATLLMGTFMGSSILLAHALGTKNQKYARQVVETTYVLSISLSVCITLLGIFISPPLMRLLHVPDAIFADATSYLRILFIGFPGMVFYYGASSLSRATGDSRTPLMFFAASAVANILLDLLFILQFGWGVPGSAWATIISQASAGAAQLIYFRKKRTFLSIHRHIRWVSSIAKRMVQLGGMTAIQQATVAINMLVLQRFVNGQGLIIVSGFVAGTQVDTYGRMAMLSTMVALAPFVSQNLGAKREDRARRGLVVALLFNFCISLFFFLVMLFFGRQVVGLFNPNPDMTRIGAEFLRISSGFYWLVSLYFCLLGFLRGSGATTLPVSISVGGSLLLPVFAALYRSQFGYHGLFFVFPTIWLLMTAALAAYFFSGQWRGKLSTPVSVTVESPNARQ